jgi:hypothetical protein
MDSKYGNTWQEDPDDIIILANKSQNNYIIDMPSGRCRLDAGRKIRTLRSIINIQQVRDLVEEGILTIE